MYISHQYYIPVHVALKSQSILGVKSHHFSLPYICISIVVVLGMFRYGSLYTFKIWISKDFRSGGSWSHLFE
jgi:hypothetical protein